MLERRRDTPTRTWRSCSSARRTTRPGASSPRRASPTALRAAPGLVVVDEAYGQFAPRSVLELRADNPHLVVVRTFSKTWSLAALRLGYAIADPEVVDAMFRVTLPYHLDALKQAAGRVALRYAAEMEDRTRRLVLERERLLVGLSRLAVEVCPSDANFVLIRPERAEAKRIWQALVEQSVLVRDVSSYEHLKGFLRVTVGTPAEDDEFLAALAVALGRPPAADVGDAASRLSPIGVARPAARPVPPDRCRPTGRHANAPPRGRLEG